VTEKIWDSFEAGCVPIYSGALGNPEPRIFNRDAFILWSFDDDNKELVDEIKRINADDFYYQRKKAQKLFLDGADVYIFSLIDAFRSNVAELLADHGVSLS
jgi:hypothetical protein